ncbi:MAG: inorganic phosphate transporter [Planctomycetaceae bacterium]|jgi:PiT family inorganic phosphate transporter|nr:inorganic phosphate transporter [Planctomycetaceae bacterium]
MTYALILVIAVIATALAFEYINGFHDAANAIATVVSTKVLTPRKALLYGACLNFCGAFFGTHVAKTIGAGIVDAAIVTQPVILCALIGAILWNLFTWSFGIPSSSSHALIGGLLGAAVAHNGLGVVHGEGLTEKVIIPMFASPLIGFLAGFFIMLVLLWIFAKASPERINKKFKFLQLISSGIMAFSHGSNDAQKTMGIITLSIIAYKFQAYNIETQNFSVPIWVIFICALMMGLGTMAGGWKIIHTIGSKVIKLKPIHGFAAETTAATTILTASWFGFPVSTTHIISTAIMGVGSTIRFSAVKWGLVGNIVLAWFLTIPICAILSWVLYKVFVPG